MRRAADIRRGQPNALRWVSAVFGVNAAILVYGIARAAAVLAGLDSKQGESLESIAAKVAYGLKVEVLATGTIETLVLKEITTGGSGALAVVKPTSSGASTPEKGEVLGSGTATIAAEGANKEATVTGLSIKVTKGEILWLVFYATESSKFERPGGETANPSSKTATKRETLSEAVSAGPWVSEKHGFARFIAEGTEGGEESFSGTATVRGGSRLTSVGAKSAAGAAALQDGTNVTAQGRKLATGILTGPIGTTQTATGRKGITGEPAVRAGTAQAATGNKTGVGEGQLRGATRMTAAGVKRSTGSAALQTGVTLVATTIETIFSGTATVRNAVRQLVAGSKGAGSEARQPAGVHQTVTGGPKNVTATAALSAGARVIAEALGKSTLGEAIIRAAVRLFGREPEPIVEDGTATLTVVPLTSAAVTVQPTNTATLTVRPL